MDIKKMNRILEAAATKDPKERERLEALAKRMQPELSDLEIVQKALAKTALELLCKNGKILLFREGEISPDEIFSEASGLLTWAKQTIGESPAPKGE